MPNNENNYRIKKEFASFLRGLSDFRVTDSETANFVNVAINQSYDRNVSYFSRSCSSWPRYNQHYIIKHLFQELEKDHVDREELMCIGMIFKKYLLLLKQVDIDRGYYTVTPGMMAGLFTILHLSLLFFPANQAIIYSSLVADLYGLGFWFFSVWSFSQHEKDLHELENALIEKINFLKSFSVSMQLTPYYSRFFSTILPSYDEVILEDMRCPEATLSPVSIASNFFYIPSVHHEHESATENTDPRQGRC
ncbi:MAG: hypothetical protein WA659_03975 [Candidatus Aquirickettsiella sp.]